MSGAVKQLLTRIEALSEKDRVELERALILKFERAWRSETTEARKIAKKRNITQATIDDAISRRRYRG